MESLTTLLFKVSEHVAYITLNRPAMANAVSLELAEELEEVARECDESSSVRAVLLTGAGRIFCGGGDLKSFAAQEPIRLPTHLKRVNPSSTVPSSASPGCVHHCWWRSTAMLREAE